MFEVGKEYKRREIHAQYGGQRQGGMSTPAAYPIILLFTGPQGEQYGYADKFQPDGLFWYTGEGQVGDMQFKGANRAVAEHKNAGKRVFLFEEARSTFVRFMGEVEYLGHHLEERPDRLGDQRQAIVFHLGLIAPASVTGVTEPTATYRDEPKIPVGASLADLRRLALEQASKAAHAAQRIVNVRVRAEAIRRYALKRAGGICRGCGKAAPFESREGPFLEVHHVYRVADGGPDHPGSVIALCPNCHREVHYGIEGDKLNERLIRYLQETEGMPPSL